MLVTFGVTTRDAWRAPTAREEPARAERASNGHRVGGRGVRPRAARARDERNRGERALGMDRFALASLTAESFAREHPTEAVRAWAAFNHGLREEIAESGSSAVVVFEDAELDELVLLLERHRLPDDAAPSLATTPADAYAPALLDEISARQRRLLTDMGFFDPGPISPPTEADLVIEAEALRDPSRPPSSDGEE